MSMSELERPLDERFAKLEAEMGKNTVYLESMISDVRGDLKALNARADGMVKKLDDLKESQNKWFAVLGFLIAAVPVILALIEKYIK